MIVLQCRCVNRAVQATGGNACVETLVKRSVSFVQSIDCYYSEFIVNLVTD